MLKEVLKKIINMDLKLEKAQTGIAGEYYAAGELSRLGYNVTMTLGNTKSIDLLIEKETKIYSIQVKTIQRTKSICWNVNKTKVKSGQYFILINLHIDQPKNKPDFFVFTSAEILEHFKNTTKEGEKRTYLDYNWVVRNKEQFQDRWSVFGEPEIESDSD